MAVAATVSQDSLTTSSAAGRWPTPSSHAGDSADGRVSESAVPSSQRPMVALVAEPPTKVVIDPATPDQVTVIEPGESPRIVTIQRDDDAVR